jgi:hypothetical protein
MAMAGRPKKIDSVDHVAEARKRIVDKLNEKATDDMVNLLEELKAAKRVLQEKKDNIRKRKEKLAEDIRETESL